MSTTFGITFLGTSAAVPTVKRNVSATLVTYRDLKWLIDCGEGTQRQITRAGNGFKNLTHVFLSHEHLDHILGMGGLLATFNMLQPVKRLAVYGNPATLDRVRQMAGFIGRSLRYDLQWHEISEGLIYTHRQLDCYAFATKHRGQAVIRLCVPGEAPASVSAPKPPNVSAFPPDRNGAGCSPARACAAPTGRSCGPTTCWGRKSPARSSFTSAIRCISMG